MARQAHTNPLLGMMLSSRVKQGSCICMVSPPLLPTPNNISLDPEQANQTVPLPKSASQPLILPLDSMLMGPSWPVFYRVSRQEKVSGLIATYSNLRYLIANTVEFIVDGSFIDCGIGEYRVELFDCWTRGLEAWHSSSIHSSVSGLSLQERIHYDWGRE